MAKKHQFIPFLLFITVILTQCQPKSEYNFQGKWQSLNDTSSVIEISENGDYQLFKKKNAFS
jgi:hypothetical protein